MEKILDGVKQEQSNELLEILKEEEHEERKRNATLKEEKDRMKV